MTRQIPPVETEHRLIHELTLDDNGSMLGIPACCTLKKLAICLYEQGVGPKLPEPGVVRLFESDPNVALLQYLGKPRICEWVQVNLDNSPGYHYNAETYAESIRFLQSNQGMDQA